MTDPRLLSVQDLWYEADFASEGGSDPLMAQADSEDGEVGRTLSDQLSAESKIFGPIGSARTGREEDAVDGGEEAEAEEIPGRRKKRKRRRKKGG